MEMGSIIWRDQGYDGDRSQTQTVIRREMEEEEGDEEEEEETTLDDHDYEEESIRKVQQWFERNEELQSGSKPVGGESDTFFVNREEVINGFVYERIPAAHSEQ
jgi:hypothetical protein